MRRVTALLLLLATLCACGSRGALYLPPPEPAEDIAVPKSKKK